jgi:hypothetical protein
MTPSSRPARCGPAGPPTARAVARRPAPRHQLLGRPAFATRCGVDPHLHGVVHVADLVAPRTNRPRDQIALVSHGSTVRNGVAYGSGPGKRTGPSRGAGWPPQVTGDHPGAGRRRPDRRAVGGRGGRPTTTPRTSTSWRRSSARAGWRDVLPVGRPVEQHLGIGEVEPRAVVGGRCLVPQTHHVHRRVHQRRTRSRPRRRARAATSRSSAIVGMRWR